MTIETIYGPPGTGKTTRLMSIIADELKYVKPEQIMFVTFTKQGAKEGIERACEKFNLSRNSFINFRTLHSTAFRQLHLSKNSQIINKKHYKELSELLGMEFTGYYTEDFKSDDDKYLFYCDLVRNNKKQADIMADELSQRTIEYVTESYNAYKQQKGVFDYTDMIEASLQRNDALDIKVALIDEAQDLTSLQWQYVWCLVRNAERVYIAGDDDQAIYEWSGADVDAFLSVPGNKTVLGHSYRLPDNILNLSKTITDQIDNRAEKEYEGTGKTGGIYYINDVDEITINEKETYLFISRNNGYLKEYVTHINNEGYPYYLKDNPSINKSEIQAIKQWEAARKNGKIDEKIRQTLMFDLLPNASLSSPWFDAFNWDYNKILEYRDLIRLKRNLDKINIKISTIHSVKGGEADNVILMTDIYKSAYSNLQKNPDSEHRVFYVGATRAKKNLYILKPQGRVYYPIGDVV